MKNRRSDSDILRLPFRQRKNAHALRIFSQRVTLMAAFSVLATARHAACCSVLRGTSACERRSCLTSFRHQDMDDVTDACTPGVQ